MHLPERELLVISRHWERPPWVTGLAQAQENQASTLAYKLSYGNLTLPECHWVEPHGNSEASWHEIFSVMLNVVITNPDKQWNMQGQAASFLNCAFHSVWAMNNIYESRDIKTDHKCLCCAFRLPLGSWHYYPLVTWKQANVLATPMPPDHALKSVLCLFSSNSLFHGDMWLSVAIA